MQESKFVGMVNQGATCYLNSLVQALYVRQDSHKPSAFRFSAGLPHPRRPTWCEKAERWDHCCAS